MHKKLTDEIVHVCQVLNQNKVQYLIVGGTAVAFHGYFRLSIDMSGAKAEKLDMDIWYNPTYENYFKLLNALEQLGQDVKEFRNEKSPDPLSSFFKFDLPGFTLDFLPKLKSSGRFRPAYNKREVTSINDTDLPIIGIDELLQDKATNSRPKDIEDIKHLKAMKKK